MFVVANPVQHQQGDLPAARRDGEQAGVGGAPHQVPGGEVWPAAAAAAAGWSRLLVLQTWVGNCFNRAVYFI